MRSHGFGIREFLLLAVLGLAMALPTAVFAQQQNQVAGVIVDADHVLKTMSVEEVGGPVDQAKIAAARASLNPKVAAYSKLRYISLKHLEEAISANQGVPTAEMRNLAGLLRLRYVFLYPDSKDIVIAGPAEGWVTDGIGRVVGLKSGRPVVQLQDLVVALRAFPPSRNSTTSIGCSIDPTQEGLAAMQHYLRSIGSTLSGPPNNQVAMNIANGLQTSLGMQVVSINGVSPQSHFAQVMVEADYRMKLIGIGLEKPPIRMVSYVDKANPAAVARNAMKRWYFVPDYECIRSGDNGMAMELVGDGVKLVGEEELVSSQGHRQGAGRSDAASQAFRDQLYQALFPVGRAFACLRRVAQLDRPGSRRRLHAARKLLRQGGMEDGLAGQREDLLGRDLQHAQESGHGRQRDNQGQQADDASRRRR